MITHFSGEAKIAAPKAVRYWSSPIWYAVGTVGDGEPRHGPGRERGDEHAHGHRAVDLVHVRAQAFVDLRGADAGASPTNSLEFGH